AHGNSTGAVPPPPHLSVRALHSGPGDQVGTTSAVELQWPPLVLSLERNWGARFDRMAHSLIIAQQQQSRKIILFTSCHRAEGRTTLVLTLARALSRDPLRTLIVDADLTGPMMARLLGLRPQVGLEDVIEAGKALTDALINASDEHLTFLPMRKAVARPRE